MKDFKMALKKNVKITDLPKNFEEEDMYLYWVTPINDIHLIHWFI
jgi:hypothetical protein